jgi:hypothetical protein
MKRVLVGLLVACAAMGCASDCEITREYLNTLHWDGVSRNPVESEYGVSTVRYGGHRFGLLGFDPWIQSSHACDNAAGCPPAFVVLGCRTNPMVCLYLIQHGKWISVLGVVDEKADGSAGCLVPEDLSRLMARLPALFTRINDTSIYAEPRYYEEIKGKGLLPPDVSPLLLHERKALVLN